LRIDSAKSKGKAKRNESTRVPQKGKRAPELLFPERVPF